MEIGNIAIDRRGTAARSDVVEGPVKSRIGPHCLIRWIALVMTWNAQAPPANWMELRDQWWQWHIVRTVAGIVALGLLIVAMLPSFCSNSMVIASRHLILS